MIIGVSLVAGIAIDALLVTALLRKTGRGLRTRQALGQALRGQPEIWAVLLGVMVFDPFAFLSPGGDVWISRLVVIATAISVTVFCTRLAGWMLRAYLRQDSVTAPSGTIFVNLARLVIWAVGLTFALGALGVQVGPLIASLGFLGLAIGLGLQDTLANFFTGLQMTLSRQVQPGDYIRLGSGDEGVVHDITWRNTTLRSPEGDLVIAPNAVMGKALLTNFTAVDRSHTSEVPFTVAYGSDLERVRHLAEEIARDVRDRADETVKDYEPTCRFDAFTTDGVSGCVTIRTQSYRHRLPVIDALVTRLHDRLVGEGVALGTIAPAAPAGPEADTE